MRRRNVGIQGLKKKKDAEAKYKSVGQELEADQLEHLKRVMAVFKENLEQFVRDHRKEINKIPLFRAQFQKLCAAAGVDPLASNKGFWADILGIGEFYYELSVQIIDVCLSTRERDGGLVAIDDLMDRLRILRGSHAQEISKDDIKRAVQKVNVLGNGFELVKAGGMDMVVTVPIEFNYDHSILLSLAQKNTRGFVSFKDVSGIDWTRQRFDQTIRMMLTEGLVWQDEGSGVTLYWFLCLFRHSDSS